MPVHNYTREAKASVPSDKNDLATVYTTPEEGDVFYSDQIYVPLTFGDTTFGMHQFKKLNDNRVDRVKVRIDLKSSLAPLSSPVYLQVWDGITNSWQTADSNNVNDANEDFTLNADVNDTSYYDFGNEFACRVYQENNSGSAKILSIDLVQISFIPNYQPAYRTTNTRYRNAYTSKKSKYRAKYPHKNPQDDSEII